MLDKKFSITHDIHGNEYIASNNGGDLNSNDVKEWAMHHNCIKTYKWIRDLEMEDYEWKRRRGERI